MTRPQPLPSRRLAGPVLIALALLLVAAGARDAPDLRIGVVDLTQVYEGYERRGTLQKELEQSGKDVEEKIATLDEKITELRDERALLEKGTTRYDEIEKELFRLVQDRKYELAQAKKRLDERRREFHGELMTEIRSAIAAYGAAEHFTAIFQKEFSLTAEMSSWQSVLYHDAAVDVTAAVLERLNAKK